MIAMQEFGADEIGYPYTPSFQPMSAIHMPNTIGYRTSESSSKSGRGENESNAD
jgi:hypothetical protein